jgi:uncharacterized OB-fold protein
MKQSLTLDYDLGEGFLAAHLDGLRRGDAIAGCCAACGRVALPPAQTCPCGAQGPVPRVLDGSATVLWRTTGADGDVALVRFDGADTLSLARLQGFDRQTRGSIAADPGAGLVLVPKDAP